MPEDTVIEFVDEILRADQEAPRKPRHTAHRIWQRIRPPSGPLVEKFNHFPDDEEDSFLAHARKN